MSAIHDGQLPAVLAVRPAPQAVEVGLGQMVGDFLPIRQSGGNRSHGPQDPGRGQARVGGVEDMPWLQRQDKA